MLLIAFYLFCVFSGDLNLIGGKIGSAGNDEVGCIESVDGLVLLNVLIFIDHIS